MPPPHPPAAGRLSGVPVVLLALAVTAPLAVVVTVVPAGYASGLTAQPLLFVGLGLLLLTFATGYVGMARRLPHSGPLYSFVARGLGRPLGLGAAGLALLSYTALQLALYGAVAAVAAPLLDKAWWVVAFGCWAVVAGCGLLRSSVTAWLIAVLVLAETVVIVGFGAAPLARARGPELMFDLAGERLAPWADTLGRVVLVAGLLAATIALHQVIVRYLLALGREQVLPAALGRSPALASLAQTVAAGAVLGGYAYAGAGPGRGLGVAGGLGILVLLTATSLAALLFGNRNPNGDGVWRRLGAPVLSTVGLGVLCYLAALDLPALLGVPVPRVWLGPAVAGAAVLAGAGYGIALRRRAPVVYAGIGLGGAAVVVSPAATPIPRPRNPGAHRPERVDR